MCISQYFRSFVVAYGVVIVLISNLVGIKDAYHKSKLKCTQSHRTNIILQSTHKYINVLHNFLGSIILCKPFFFVRRFRPRFRSREFWSFTNPEGIVVLPLPSSDL